jgi:hypothetical protein
MSQAQSTIASKVTPRLHPLAPRAALFGVAAMGIIAAVALMTARTPSDPAAGVQARVETVTITPAIQAIQDGWEVKFLNEQAAKLQRAQAFQDGWEVKFLQGHAAMLERAQAYQDGWEIAFRNEQAAMLERAQAFQDGWEIRLLR